MRIAGKMLGVALALAVAAAAAARGDVVIKNSGETLKGLIVAEAENDITLQTNVDELVVRTKIARKDIREFHKDIVAQNRYCRIPIHGEIGRDVKAEWLAKSLEQARGFGANYIVLDIDSPGGDVAEMAKIMELLSRQEKLTLIAHVHKAMSAAAMIAMTCPTIVMDNRASIGAAVPWKIGPDGTPRDVEAKFLSAYRALCKSAAQFAHHSPLLAQGMMDLNLTLSMQTHNGSVEISDDTVESRGVAKMPEAQGWASGDAMARGGAATPAVGEQNAPVAAADEQPGRVLKKKGEILCLSATEAVECGLAAGIAEWPRELQKAAGAKDWSAVGESVWSYMESRPVAEKANLEREQTAKAATAAKLRLAQELAAVEARITTVTKAKADAAKQTALLPEQFKGEMNKLDPRLSATEHDVKSTEIKSRYQALYDHANQTLAQSDAELADLAAAKTKLTAALQE